MFKVIRKIRNNKKGFTLTEVMIGITILTVAIVSASNLLVMLISSNSTNVNTMKAYYLAQEGIEAIRNIRDTNWLHNENFKGDGEIYDTLEYDTRYAVFLKNEGWRNSDVSGEDHGTSDMAGYIPWDLEKIGGIDANEQINDKYALDLNTSGDDSYYTSSSQLSDAEFYRYVDILKPCDEEECDDFILVRSVVKWEERGKIRDVTLEAVLTNWKGGVL